MTGRSVVITGTGLVTPLGTSIAENLAGIGEGRTGISQRENMAGVPERMRWSGRVAEIPSAGEINRKLLSQMKFLNRGSHLGFAAAREAVAASDMNFDDLEPQRKALYIASGDLTNIDYGFFHAAMKDATRGKFRDIDPVRLNESALSKVNPFYLLDSISNNLFSFLSAYYGIMGANTSVASLSPCGSLALELAVRSVARGRADTALAVGCGAWVTEVPIFELDGLGVLSASRNGAASYKPFDVHRDGFVPGEGGAAVVIETEDSAKARGAKILGRVIGLGNSIEHTGGRGFAIPKRVSARCIQNALADCGLEPGSLGFLLPHGSATRRGDRSELSSISAALGDRRRDVPVSALKPYTGHMGAASDLGEIALGLEFLREGRVPATLNFKKAEPEFADMMISNEPQPTKNGSFMTVSYGVGGQASAVVVGAA